MGVAVPEFGVEGPVDPGTPCGANARALPLSFRGCVGVLGFGSEFKYSASQVSARISYSRSARVYRLALTRP